MFDALKRLITPPDFQDEEKNRAAGILFPLLLLLAVAIFFVLLADLGNVVRSLVVGGFLALVLGSLVLTWRGHLTIPRWLVPLSALAALTYLIAVGNGLHDTSMVGFPLIIVIAALFLGAPGIIVFGLLTILAVTGIAQGEISGVLVNDYSSGADYADLAVILPLLGLASAVLFALVHSLTTALRAARQNAAALTTANRELERLRGELADRVAARTRDLTLAAELGRDLSQMRDLDRLLHQAVERIQEQFDLYYAQIYLTDEPGRTLFLQAGTGEVGRELQRRSHRLPVENSSINGAAVLYKRPVIVPNTADDPTFRPNPLLPHTRSEMAVPLLLGDETVGVLNLQAAEPNALSDENLAAFEALSGQLAVAISNARLLAEVSEANAELQAYARRLTREQWETFLDAIHHEEEVGYVYSGGEIVALDEAAGNGQDAVVRDAPIQVGGETVGVIQVEGLPGQPIPAETLQIVEAIAHRVGQQVENLRLLEEAERSRSEAEATMRRVTQQQWREHQEVSDLSLAGYRYDSRQVEVMEDVEIDTADLEPDLVRQPLQVRGGTVGYLEAVAGGEKETSELVTAVAGQLSAHLESLRLTAQTERALAAAQKRSEEMININHIVSLVATSLDVQESLQLIAIELAQTLDVPQVHVAIFDEDKTEMEIAAAFTSDDSLAGLEGDKYKVSSLPLYEKLLATRQTLRLSADEEMAEMAPIYEALRWRGVTGILLIPMMTGNKVLGAVSIHITDPEREISDDEQRIAETIVYQASTAVENARLFAQTQEALSEMAALSQIGAALNAAQNYEDVVTAVAGILRSRTNGSLRAALFHVDIDERERPVQLRLMSAEGSDLSDAVRRPIPVGEMPGFHLWQSSPEGVFLLGDVMSDPRLSERDRELFQQTETRSAALMPLRLSAQWVGFFGLLWTEPVVFTAEDERFYQSVEDELSLVVNNLQLLDATQRQARREQMLRRITSRVYAAPDAESILRAAAQEVQQALDLEAFAYLEEDPPAVGNGRTDGESAVAPDASAEQRI